MDDPERGILCSWPSSAALSAARSILATHLEMTLLKAPGLGLFLLAFWLVLSGHFEPLLIGLGIGSTVLVVFISVRMGLVDREGVPLDLASRFAVYFVWLMKEVVVANFHVARIILDPRLPISPVLVTYHVSPRTDLGRVIYANSITLTPGPSPVASGGPNSRSTPSPG